jgi:hypothetical protein
MAAAISPLSLHGKQARFPGSVPRVSPVLRLPTGSGAGAVHGTARGRRADRSHASLTAVAEERRDPRGDVRNALGSWLQGPRGAGADLGYPGERLGLPAAGPGSVAGFGARLVAFALDSLMCAAIAWGVFRDPVWVTPIFAAEAFVLTALGGASAGQRLRRLRVARLDGRPVGAVRALVRTLLLCLLVPALIWDRDGRGLHDRAVGTVVVHHVPDQTGLAGR